MNNIVFAPVFFYRLLQSRDKSEKKKNEKKLYAELQQCIVIGVS